MGLPLPSANGNEITSIGQARLDKSLGKVKLNDISIVCKNLTRLLMHFKHKFQIDTDWDAEGKLVHRNMLKVEKKYKECVLCI